jgi:hypothetical protein
VRGAAAETAMDVCLGLKREGRLWSDVVPRFRAAGAQGQLLERLLSRIVAGQLHALAPEVMQVCCSPRSPAGPADMLARSPRVCAKRELIHNPRA